MAMSEKKSKKPAWAGQQQKTTGAKSQEQRANEAPKTGMVKIKMLTDYRDVAKAGDVWETDAVKAEELVNLKRAEYVK